MSFSLLVSAALAAGSPVAKADDAVDAFSQLCVTMFAGKKSDIDSARFATTRLDADTVRQIKPNLAGQTVWDVNGKASNVSLLVHIEPAGMCVVEVAEAEEAALRSAFSKLVNRTADELVTSAQADKDRVNVIEGKPATTSLWKLKTKGRIVALAITTYPEPKFMIQHLMTASYIAE